MKLMIMYPAESQCVFPTVNGTSLGFFSPLKVAATFFLIYYSCHHHSPDVCYRIVLKTHSAL